MQNSNFYDIRYRIVEIRININFVLNNKIITLYTSYLYDNNKVNNIKISYF